MKKLAIVGTHKDTRKLAPYDDPDFDIWVFNEAMSQLVHDDDGQPVKLVPRASAVFQLHEPAVYMSPNNRSDKFHWQWLQAEHGDLAIYMQERDPLVPNAVKLDLDELRTLLGDFRQGLEREKRDYFTSSPAIALALAIVQGYEYIEIYGINMGSETEYQFQREGFLFWIGYALGRGIRVEMISGDDIFNRPIYGYEGYIESPPEMFRERIAELKPQIQAARYELRTAEDELEAGWMNGVQDHITRAAAAKTALGYLEGQLHENERFLFKVEQMQRDNKLPFIDLNEFEMSAAAAQKEQMVIGPNVYRTVGHVDLTVQTIQYTGNPAYLPQMQFHVKEHLQANYDYGREQGKFEENRRLAKLVGNRLKAAGGHKTVLSIMDTPEPEGA